MSLKQTVFDGWMNLLTGLGVSGKDKRMGLEAEWSRMDQSTAESTYAVDDIAATVVDLLPDEAFREGFKLKNIDKDVESKIHEQFERLEAFEKMNEAWKLARIYGGAGVLMIVDDGLDLSEPLQIEKVRSIKNLVVFNRWELVASYIQRDITMPDFGMPISYRVSPQSTASTFYQEIHASRILRFDGTKLTRRQFVANNYWGDSILTRLLNALKNYNSVHDSAASALQDFNVDVFKLKNLAELVASGQESQIKTRIDIANLSKSVNRAMLIDLDETYETKSRPLTGVTDILNKADERLTAASRTPHTLLLGQSPSGMNATGNSEERNWYNYVRSQQELVLKKKLNLLFQLIEKTIGVEFTKTFSWEFKPLWQETEKQKAETRLIQAQTDRIYLDTGVLDATEVAASRFGGEDYSLETQLDPQTRLINSRLAIEEDN